jgi:hypothetical protein
MWKKFKKKPIIVRALQLTEDNKDIIYHTVKDVIQSVNPSRNKDGKPCLIISTLEGDMIANIGDWIIEGVNGEIYPCKSDIFEKTYDEFNNKNENEKTINISCLNCGVIRKVNKMLWDIGKTFKCNNCNQERFKKIK